MRRVQNWLRSFGLLCAFAWLALVPAQAGSSADSRVGLEKFGAEAIRTFALYVNDELDRHRVNVGIIARVGRPRSDLPAGITYTHVAFVVFEAARDPEGKIFHTYTVYNLYQGADGHPDRSYLKQDLTYDFVSGICEPDVAVCVPDEPLQRRILAVIRSPAYGALHNPNYNLLANPGVDRYDNCATHLLKICVAAIYDTSDRTRIYADIRAYFRPTQVHLGLVQSLGSNFMSDVHRDDRTRSNFQTASYDSIKAFLETNHLAQETFVIRLTPAVPIASTADNAS